MRFFNFSYFLKQRFIAGIWFAISAFLAAFLELGLPLRANFNYMTYALIFFASFLGFIIGFLLGYRILLLSSSVKGIFQAIGIGILGVLIVYVAACIGLAGSSLISSYRDCAADATSFFCADVASFSAMLIAFTEGSFIFLIFGVFFAIHALIIGIFSSVLLYFMRNIAVFKK